MLNTLGESRIRIFRIIHLRNTKSIPGGVSTGKGAEFHALILPKPCLHNLQSIRNN